MASEYQVGALSGLISGKTVADGEATDLFTTQKKQKTVMTKDVPVKKRKVSTATAGPLPDSSTPSKVQRPAPPVDSKLEADSEDDLDRSEAITQFHGPSLKYRVRDEDEKKRVVDPEKDARSIFVGNLPATVPKKKLVKLFSPYGQVESVRLRCAARPDPKTMKRVAVIKGTFHENRHTINAFVVFRQPSEAQAALALNGTEFRELTLRVDSAVPTERDNKKSVFVGNLAFSLEEEDLRKHFCDCGAITDVRIIRDSATGVGKGFGYVSFATRDAVEVALRKNLTRLGPRPVRVDRCAKKGKVSVPVVSNNKQRVQGSKYKKPILKKTTRKKLQAMKDTEFQGKSHDAKSGDKNPKKKGKPKLNKIELDMIGQVWKTFKAIFWNLLELCFDPRGGKVQLRDKSRSKPHSKRFSFVGIGEDEDEDESHELLLDDDDVEKGFSDQDEVDMASRQRTPLENRLGSLRFRLEYRPEKESLLVTIVDAVDLPAMDSNGKADPYVAVYLKPGAKRFTTSIKSKSRNPTFNETADLPLKEAEIMHKDLILKVIDSDYPLQDELIGIIRVPLSQVDLLQPVAKHYTCLIINQSDNNGQVTLNSDDSALMNLRISEQNTQIYDLEVRLKSTQEKFNKLSREYHELKIHNFELEMEPFKDEFSALESLSNSEEDLASRRLSPLAFLNSMKPDLLSTNQLKPPHPKSAPVSKKGSPKLVRNRKSLQGEVEGGQTRAFQILETLRSSLKVKDAEIEMLRGKIKQIAPKLELYSRNGQIEVGLTFNPDDKKLKIDIFKATNLRSVNLHGDHSDPFVKVKVFRVKPGKKTERWKFESKPVWKNINPVFNLSYVVDKVEAEDLGFMSTEIVIMDKAHLRSDRSLGKLRLGPNVTTDLQHWEVMTNNPGKRHRVALAFRAAFLTSLLAGCASISIKCDPGWYGLPESQSCFRFMRHSENNYDNSRTICQNLGGELAIIDTPDRRNYVASVIGQIHESTSKWWVGIHFNEDGAKWVWGDGSALNENITPWDDNDENLEGKCGGITHNGKLSKTDCSTAWDYVCQKKIGSKFDCPLNWDPFGDSCYKTYMEEEPKGFEEAQAHCQSEDESSLVIIETEHENAFLADISTAFKKTFWIGASDNATGKFYWLDGTELGQEPHDFQNWGDEQPVSTNTSAVYLDPNNEGKWITMAKSERQAFICERAKGAFCQMGLQPGPSDKCYDFNLNLQKTFAWDLSQVTCEKYGMNLVSVSSSEESEWVNKALYDSYLFSDGNQVADGTWIGYKEKSDKPEDDGKFSNIDGTIDLDNEGVFDGRQDDLVYQKTIQECLYMKVCLENETDETCDFLSTKDKRWFNSPCDMTGIDQPSHTYACESLQGKDLDLSNAIQVNQSCPEDWRGPFVGFCYNPLPVEVTWGEGVNMCKDLNAQANLASILSPLEDQYVRSLILTLKHDAWIGLNDRLTANSWQWSDESPFNYAGWAEGQPNDYEEESCVEINPSRVGWNDDKCSNKQSIVCKVAATTQQGDEPVVPQTTTAIPTENCGYGWFDFPVLNNGKCYTIVEELMSWNSAQTECEIRAGYQRSGNLVSVNSNEENIALATYLSSTGQNGAHWIGLNDYNAEGGFEWRDGSPVTFVSWADGEPNAMVSFEDCVEMAVDDSQVKWNDHHCNKTIPAICQRHSRHYEPPTKPPPTKPQCPDGWLPTMDKCYWFSAPKDVSASNWTHAKDLCKSQDPLASLTTTINQEEREFVAAHIYGKSFIGATDVNNEGEWVWDQTGDIVQVNFWAEGEPNGQDKENCMAIDHEGNWADVPCTVADNKQMDFVCSVPNDMCPEDWIYFDGHCWIFHDDIKDFDSAEQSCGELNHRAHLASVLNREDNWFVRHFISEDQPAGNWLGLKLDGEDWTWTDKSPLGYTDWDADANEPDQPEEQKCGWVDPASRMWRSGQCNNDKNFMCKFEPTHVRGCDPGWELWEESCYLAETIATDWTSAQRDCVVKGGDLVSVESNEENDFINTLIHTHSYCKSGWIPDLDLKRCFKIISTDMVWEDAAKECDLMGGTLISIKSEEKNTKMLDLVKNANVYKMWLGATDKLEEGKFMWLDETPIDDGYMNWMEGQPSNDDPGEQCLSMLVQEDYFQEPGKWNDDKCDSTEKFICETNFQDEEAPVEKMWIGLSDLESLMTFKWSDHHPGSCYEFHGDALSYFEAKAKCQDTNGDLVSLNTWEEIDKITSVVAEHPHHYWIGLISHDGAEFIWQDGSAVYETNWGPEEPNNERGQCVHVMDRVAIGKWEVQDCSNQHSYICEKPRAGYTVPPPPPTSTYVPINCPDTYSWVSYEGHCYKIIEDSAGFEAGRDACRALGADAVSFTSEEEDTSVVSKLLVTSWSTSFFIGLRLSENPEEGFYWVDGSPVNYVNWISDPTSDKCAIATTDGTSSLGWQSMNCEESYPIVCEISQDQIPTTPPRPTSEPDIPCEGSEGWWQRESNDEFCYKFDATGNSWFDAEKACSSEKGHLVSIHDMAENDYIFAKMHQVYADTLWIGTTRRFSENWMWKDQSPSDFFNWAPDEPNNDMGMESCGRMYIAQQFGQWNDDHCGERASFACKKYRDPDAITNPPITATPPGHCPPDQAEYEGQCFKLIDSGLEGEHSLPYQEAELECRKLGSTYHLASIHNLGAMSFLSTLMVHPDVVGTSFWIGLNKGIDHMNFIWTDESNNNYFNWEANQPSYDAYVDCVKIMGSGSINKIGQWSVAECYENLPYICRGRPSLDNSDPPPTEKCALEGFDHFDSFYGNCYLYVKEEKSWNDAEQYCQEQNAHLASVENLAENSYLVNFMAAQHTWIGLSNVGHHEEMAWSDGWPTKYDNWGNDLNIGEDMDLCGQYNNTDGKWFATACDEKLSFACKYSEKVPPTLGPFGECPENWEDLPGPFCYNFLQDSELGVPFSEALFQCQKQGGDLLSIGDAEENERIQKFVQDLKRDIWIGLVDVGDGDWKWSDNSAFVYTNWAPDEPNDVSEECAMMFHDNGQWNDFNCNTYELGYVCKRDKKGLGGGAIAGIVIGCLIAVGGAIAGLMIVKQHNIMPLRQFSKGNQKKTRTTESYDSPVYMNFQDEDPEEIQTHA
eukprot:TCALIF_00439-PB protein Name:"Similar to MRC1 Macrophage mannose receptor 1 (Homo sapiens)" AED:0.06 eAED:0.07 QI:7/0.88/0.83/1/0.74/0.69/36/84/3089